MNKYVIYICFLWPFISSCLFIQNYIALYYSDSYVQLVAYLNLMLIIAGCFLLQRDDPSSSKTSRLWFIFFLIYYSFALLSTGITGFNTSIIASLIPVIYVIGFYFLFRDKRYFKICFRVITITFIISSLFTIIFHHLNFSLDLGGVSESDLDRAGGLYGDANNAALVSILTFLLADKLIKPQNLIIKVLKIILLGLIFYSLFITFSTTGLFTFVIVLVVTNLKFFRGMRIIYLALAIIIFYIFIFSIKSQTKSLNLSEAQIVKIDNIVNLLTLNIEKVDNSGRDALIDNALYYLNENPIRGNGVNFSIYKRAHNTYIGIWIDAGLFAFLFFLIMLSLYIFRALSLPNSNRFFISSCLITLYIFLISLQSVLNQPYLIILFVFFGYMIDHRDKEEYQLNIFENGVSK